MTDTKRRRKRRPQPRRDSDAQRQRELARIQETIALLESWIAEDAAGDPQAQEADWEDFKAALNANRAGERPLFV